MALDTYRVHAAPPPGLPTPCWEWTGRRNADGYGLAYYKGRNEQAHRAMYLDRVGEIPPGLVLDHLCRFRACINPDHMDPVTQKVNVYRGTSPAASFITRDECERGHKFTEENTYLRKEGGRRCRRCEADRQRAKQYRKRRREQSHAAATSGERLP